MSFIIFPDIIRRHNEKQEGFEENTERQEELIRGIEQKEDNKSLYIKGKNKSESKEVQESSETQPSALECPVRYRTYNYYIYFLTQSLGFLRK